MTPRTPPLRPLAVAVAAWTAAEMGLPAPTDLPVIGFLDQRTLSALRKASLNGASRHFAERVVALYDDDRAMILLPEGWTGATPAEISMLVHEMAHHLQAISGRPFDCPAAREAQAYDLQDRWLAQFDSSLAIEFEMNALSRVLLSRCGPP